jgi:hypothetical protein
MEIKIGVVETHHYTGVRELERVDLEKFPIIKYYLDVNPNATEEDLLKYIKKIKDEDFKKFLDELSWNEVVKEDFNKSKTKFVIKLEK